MLCHYFSKTCISISALVSLLYCQKLGRLFDSAYLIKAITLGYVCDRGLTWYLAQVPLDFAIASRTQPPLIHFHLFQLRFLFVISLNFLKLFMSSDGFFSCLSSLPAIRWSRRLAPLTCLRKQESLPKI